MQFLKHTDSAVHQQRHRCLAKERPRPVFFSPSPTLLTLDSDTLPLLITHPPPQTSLHPDPRSLPLLASLIQFIFHCFSRTHSPSPFLYHYLLFFSLPTSIPSYFSRPPSLPSMPCRCPVPPRYLCCNSIPIAASAFHLGLDVK